MNPTGERLLSLYRHALRLYPHPFQEEYAEELTAVFALRLQAQEPQGILPLFKTTLHELRDLPPSLAAAYLRERRRQIMKRSLDHWFTQNYGSGREVLLAVMPFLLMGFMPGLLSKIPLVQNQPQLVGFIILGSLFLILAALGIIGLLVELPRWSLLYAGISLSLFALSMVISPGLFDLYSLPSEWPSWSSNAVLLGSFLIILALSTWILLWAAGHIRIMKPFAANIRNDRSLLPFMMFGGSYLFVIGHYEDLADGGWYLVASSLVMVAGAWVFLRAEKLSTKLWALVAANTLGNGIALTANLVLFPSPSWVVEVGSWHFPAVVLFVSLTWLSSLVMILTPLAFLPRQAAPTNPSPTAI